MNLPESLKNREPFLWVNPHKKADLKLPKEDMEIARRDWQAFSPLLQELFQTGRIDSVLTHIPKLYEWHKAASHQIKQDNALPVAGSIKARGGFFEVLCHARDLAVQEGIIKSGDSLEGLAHKEDFFGSYALHVASTGNLGLSIGLMGRALGFDVYVHMSADAKEWKKKILRDKGANVIEYAGDYSLAVRKGREESEKDPKSYFVDDERSLRLFWGYSKAGYDLQEQLPGQITKENPLFVAIPCGVGGAPGGIAYALKALYGDHVHLFFAEPLEAPAVLLGMASGKGEGISVQEIGLSGDTLADGLAVGKPSGFVCEQMKEVLSGIFTVKDEALQAMQHLLWEKERIKAEPSACAGLLLPYYLQCSEGKKYLEQEGLQMEDIHFVYWSTGGERIPEDLYLQQLEEGRQVLEENPDIFTFE